MRNLAKQLTTYEVNESLKELGFKTRILPAGIIKITSQKEIITADFVRQQLRLSLGGLDDLQIRNSGNSANNVFVKLKQGI
jgi:hypothetical protein